MLTADLVRTRRRGRELLLTPLDEPTRARATDLCARLLEAAEAHLGRTRDELEDAWAAIEAAPRDRRLLEALRKLVEDRCQFGEGGADEELDPEALRRTLFERAAAARREEGAGGFDREALLAQLAGERGLTLEALERGLFSDLRGAQLLRAVEPTSARALVDGFDVAQAQAVLLRAVRVVCEVECASAGGYRALFRKLKFLRLLYAIDKRPGGGYRLAIDGPYSLFESATKYGLQLALALPALLGCDAVTLEADVRWGKEREALTFRLASKGAVDAGPPARLPDEVQALREAIAELGGPWRAAPATKILDLPGVGVCVPDLEFRREGLARPVYLEVMGFWSRDAVWRRVEMVEKGLGERVLFAVSQHLRVSEQALGDDAPSALYVYKRALSARSIIERLERLAAR